ncbi:MAG TPA: sigma-70 family RNA polymerase sigma factor [Gemmataceae bacterium]|nr:sigma-70 family RNA polymerase sigma factor [Gemmataceae bacterium]
MSGTSGSGTRASLIERIRGGDGWKEFVDVYGGMILRWCRDNGVRPQDAEDITHDILVSIHARIQKYKPDGDSASFRRWLKAVVLNRWRDIKKKGDGRMAHFQDGAELERACEELVAYVEPVHRRLVVEELLTQVEARLTNPVEWVVFYLCDVVHWSPKEVADLLGVKLTSLYAYRSRAKKVAQTVFEPADLAG